MATYPDAIGYIRDLGRNEGLPWLEMICDLATVGDKSLSSDNLEVLVQLFIESASYIRQSPSAASAVSTATIRPLIEKLESIGPFTGFKHLSNTLEASFPKQATIIFGANGSGKSSLCEALQILASRDSPKRPIHDVHSDGLATPSFNFKFASDSTVQSWTYPDSFGTKSNVLKYFDSEIAVHNINDSVQPGRIIELSPFRLDVFETAKNFCEELRREAQRMRDADYTDLNGIVEQIRILFGTFEGYLLGDLTMESLEILDGELKLGESFSEGNELDDQIKKKDDLEKAISEDGLRILKGEISALKIIIEKTEPMLGASEELLELNPDAVAKTYKEKERELEKLASALIPSGSTLDQLLALIRSANEVCDFHSSELKECPLCKQKLHDKELELFKEYADLLSGELEREISVLRKTLNRGDARIKELTDSDPEGWVKDSILETEILERIMEVSTAIRSKFQAHIELDQECHEAVESMKELNRNLNVLVKQKEELVKNAEEGREDLLKKLEQISIECQKGLYKKEIYHNIGLVKEAIRLNSRIEFWDSRIPDFTTVLRKITSTAKKAHKDLVVGDFRSRLNAEYLALAEKEMSDFGVDLKDVDGEGAVTVVHHVGGQSLEEVLSEGELRIHALALFFAELETCNHQVIVFDDPVSSFDYNYIGSYCQRLRDLIQAYPDRQVIVLTHNWEFFVQIQSTLNTSHLNNQFSVHVLERCVEMDEYHENIDHLKSEIDGVLAYSGEPSNKEKEFLAGRMRRLIESIVNTHVFNNQRHQFKQKSQPVSTFDKFTKIVPLLTVEAQTLRDLYAKLSITEHDDPRNAYVNTDKATFRTRYNSIISIENAVIGRKLP